VCSEVTLFRFPNKLKPTAKSKLCSYELVNLLNYMTRSGKHRTERNLNAKINTFR